MRPSSLLLVAGLALVACKPTPAAPEASTKAHKVFALAYPTVFVAQTIGGDAAKVIDARPDHEDPEAWEPSSELVFTMKEDASVVLVGGGFEPWFRPENVSQFLLYELMKPLEGSALKKSDGSPNPFVWLEPESFDLAARGLADHFARLMPQEEAGLRARQKKLSERLADLDQQLRAVGVSAVFGTHPGHAYAARAMGARFEHLAVDLDVAPASRGQWKKRLESFPAGVVLVPRAPASGVGQALRAAGLEPVVFELLATRSAEDRRAGRDYFGVYAQNIARLKAALQAP